MFLKLLCACISPLFFSELLIENFPITWDEGMVFIPLISSSKKSINYDRDIATERKPRWLAYTNPAFGTITPPGQRFNLKKLFQQVRVFLKADTVG